MKEAYKGACDIQEGEPEDFERPGVFETGALGETLEVLEQLEVDELVELPVTDRLAEVFEGELLVEELEPERGGEVVVYYLTSNSSRGLQVLMETRELAILDQCQSCMEPRVGGKIAENGKLVDQRGKFHQYCEVCMHMAFLA
jgi:hypothetical protein